MPAYYIPVSGYYDGDKAFLIGPFSSKDQANEWMEQAVQDKRIDRYGHPRDFDNLFVVEPFSLTQAKRSFAVTLREGRVIPTTTNPSFDDLKRAIEAQIEYLDATR